jgi:hypothetical protein
MRQQETLVLLQTFSTRDFDELGEGFRRWELPFQQGGDGAFRGELKFVLPGGFQVLRASCNRRLYTQGSPPSGSFGFAPVLPRNEGPVWSGRPRPRGGA